MATAAIRLLAWEPPYAVGVALEKTKKKKKKKEKKNIYIVKGQIPKVGEIQKGDHLKKRKK